MKTSTFLKVFRQESGFSLTEIMVGGGILAGVALAGAQMFNSQRQAQARIEQDQALIDYHHSLQREMGIAANCNATLEAFDGADIGDVSSLKRCTGVCELPQSSPGEDIISEGAFTDNRQIWRVERITVPPISNSGPLEISVEYRLNPRISSTPRTITKKINLNVLFSAPNDFHKCIDAKEASIDNLQKDLCKAMNYGELEVNSGALMYWNEETRTCEKDTNTSVDCSATGLVIDGVGVNATGLIQCRPLTTDYDANSMQDPTPTTCTGIEKPELIFDTVTRKFKVVCQSPGVICYVDSDGDGFGVGAPVTRPSCSGGYASVAGDCCDSDNRAYPGATVYQGTASNCGGYDFNCDGSITKNTRCDSATAVTPVGPTCTTACGSRTYSTLNVTYTSYSCGTSNTIFKPGINSYMTVSTCSSGNVAFNTSSTSLDFCTGNAGGFSSAVLSNLGTNTCTCR